MELSFTNTAIRALSKLQHDTRARILAKINDLVVSPGAFAKVKKLKGSDQLRLRVGDYRVIYVQSAEQIIIRDVGHRSTIYD